MPRCTPGAVSVPRGSESRAGGVRSSSVTCVLNTRTVATAGSPAAASGQAPPPPEHAARSVYAAVGDMTPVSKAFPGAAGASSDPRTAPDWMPKRPCPSSARPPATGLAYGRSRLVRMATSPRTRLIDVPSGARKRHCECAP